MAELVPIRIRRGAEASLPAAVDGCPLWTEDTHQLFVGQGGTNWPVGYSVEQTQDIIGGILLDSATIDFTYDDATPSITATIKSPAALINYSAENKDAGTIWAGMVCAVHSSGTGVVLASAADNTKVAVGLMQTATNATFSGPVQTEGLFKLANWTAVTGTASLSANAVYFLDPASPGTLTTTRPTAAGQIVQAVGVAVSSDTLDLFFDAPYLLS